MEEFQQKSNTELYIENILSSYKKYLVDIKNYEKSLIQSGLNEFLLNQIKEAEIESEEFQKGIIKKFREEIEDIEKRKVKEGDENALLSTEEEFIKRSFERQIRTSEKSLTAIIEMCKNQIK